MPTIDELRRALADAGGDPPDVDGGLARVTTRVRRQRRRTRSAIAVVACGVVVAVVATAVARSGSGGGQRVVVTAPSGSPAISHFTWTRVEAPAMSIERVVVVDGHTYAVGGVGGDALVEEIAPNARPRAVLFGRKNQGSKAFDLADVRGALVAVGTDGTNAAAWRSTNGGVTWHPVPVEAAVSIAGDPGFSGQEGPASPATIARLVVASHGTLYAIGEPRNNRGDAICGGSSAWTTSDGTDFRLVPGCTGSELAAGPAGLVTIHGTGTTSLAAPPASPRIATVQGQAVAVASDGRGYVVVGTAGPVGHGLPGRGAIWWSVDGVHWQQVATATNPVQKGFARFTGVTHTAGGWIAVGYQSHPNANEKIDDAIVWTSADGRHWQPDARDHATFEQYAHLDGVGLSSDGVVLFGATQTGGGVAGDPLNESQSLWFGRPASSTPSTTRPPTQSAALTCPVQPPQFLPRDQVRGAGSRFVPGAPNELLACRYHGFNQAQPIGSLASSALFPVDPIVRELNQAKAPPSGVVWGCPADFGEKILLIFGYRDGSRLEIEVPQGGCEFASNGNFSIETPQAVFDALLARLGHDTTP